MDLIRRILRFFRPSPRLFILLAVSLLGVGIFFFIQLLNRKPTSASSDWYNDDWLYRKSISFGNSGATVTDRKVKVDVDTAALIAAGKMQDDCGDTRFTTLNGQVLDYYLDSTGGAYNTNSTDFWVRVPTVHAGETAIYIYYGNTAAENGTLESQLLQTTFTPTSGPTVGDEESGPGPVAYWKFDEGEGQTANDSAGGSTGALGVGASAPSWVSEDQCISGQCLEFDGDDYVEAADSDVVDIVASISVCAWVKRTDGIENRQRIVDHTEYTDSSNNGGYLLEYNGVSTQGTWRFNTFDDAVTSVTFVDTTTDWHFLCGVSDGSTSKIYQNGVEKNAIASTGPGVKQNTTLTISNATHPFSGLIDEVKIYDTALTAEQVKLEYNAGKAVVMGSTSTDSDGKTPDNSASREYCVPGDTSYCAPPVAEWLMDDGEGTTAADTSTNGNSGTLVNGTAWMVSSHCKSGSCVSFDGEDDYVEIADTDDLSFGDGSTDSPFSVSAWVYYRDAGGNSPSAPIVGKYRSYNPFNGEWNFAIESSGTLHFQVLDNEAIKRARQTSDMTMPKNQWMHLAAVYNGSGVDEGIALYKDGVLLSSTGMGQDGSYVAMHNRSSEVTIGSILDEGLDFFSGYVNGLIDQVRIYDYARTPAQVAWDMNKGAPAAHYRFDECEGTTAHDSASGSHGTIDLGASGVTSAGTCATSGAWYNSRSGKRNASFSFDGSDDRVDTGSDIIGIGEGSFCAWIYPKGWGESNAGRILDNGTFFFNINFSGSSIRFSSNGSTTLQVNNVIALNQWIHVCGTRTNSGAGIVYINGRRATGGTGSTGTPTAGSTNVFIGNTMGANRTFNGQIDDVKVFNYVLTPEQVKTEYNAGAVNFE